MGSAFVPTRCGVVAYSRRIYRKQDRCPRLFSDFLRTDLSGQSYAQCRTFVNSCGFHILPDRAKVYGGHFLLEEREPCFSPVAGSGTPQIDPVPQLSRRENFTMIRRDV